MPRCVQGARGDLHVGDLADRHGRCGLGLEGQRGASSEHEGEAAGLVGAVAGTGPRPHPRIFPATPGANVSNRNGTFAVRSDNV